MSSPAKRISPSLGSSRSLSGIALGGIGLRQAQVDLPTVRVDALGALQQGQRLFVITPGRSLVCLGE